MALVPDDWSQWITKPPKGYTVTLLDLGEPHITSCLRCGGILVRYILKRDDTRMYVEASWVHATVEMQEACKVLRGLVKGARC